MVSTTEIDGTYPVQTRIVVIGSANADLNIPVGRRPEGGETTLGGKVSVFPGGKGANQAVAASKLGAEVYFIGCVGDDGHGELLRRSLCASGVNVDGLRTVDGPTSVAIITVTPDGENSIIVAEGANAAVQGADIDRALGLLGPGGLLVLQLEIPRPVAIEAARRAAERGSRVILNAAPAAEMPAEILRLCDPLVVNESELATLLGLEGAVVPDSALATHIRQWHIPSVVVTLGSDGAYIVTPETAQVLPAAEVGVIDTTGAGDAFVGALARELSRGFGLVDAVGFAIRVAATSVTRSGAQPSFPTADEVMDRHGLEV